MATANACEILCITHCPACGEDLDTTSCHKSICGFADGDFPLEHFTAWVSRTMHPEEEPRTIERMIVLHAEDTEYWRAVGWPKLRDAAYASI